MTKKYEKPQLGFIEFKSKDKVNVTLENNANFASETPNGIGSAAYSKVSPLAKQ